MSTDFPWIPSGWIPDLPDFRDYPYQQELAPDYPSVDLRPMCSIIENQMQLGSCTANAVVGALELLENMKNETFIDLSRLFVYYNTRAYEGTISNGDSSYGAGIRNAIKTTVDIGVCKEVIWPYVQNKWNVTPTQACYIEAIDHRATAYYRLGGFDDMINCLANGWPFVIGIYVYNSWYLSDAVAVSGNITMPEFEEVSISGHAILVVGYNHAERRFLFRNSWGSNWGNGGYGTIPYDYLADPLSPYLGDIWTLRQFYSAPVIIPPNPDDIVLQLNVIPPPGRYTTPQVVTIFQNKPGTIYIAINGLNFQQYVTGVPISSDTSFSVYFKNPDGTTTPTIDYYYTIDLHPLVISYEPPEGVYRHALVKLTGNQPCQLLYMLRDGASHDYVTPISITESTQVVYHGVAHGLIYPSASISYTIDPTVQPDSFISPTPGSYFTAQVIKLSSFEPGIIKYSIDGGPEQTYTAPFILNNSATITYHWDDSTIVNTASYVITPSNMVYCIDTGKLVERFNVHHVTVGPDYDYDYDYDAGYDQQYVPVITVEMVPGFGPWIDYTGPFECKHYHTVMAAIKYPDGTLSEPTIVHYNIVDTSNQWVIVG